MKIATQKLLRMGIARAAMGSVLLAFCFTNCGKVEPASYSNPGSATLSFSNWTKESSPVFSGDYNIASDPTVFKDGSIYRMYYTCYYVDVSQSTPAGPYIRRASPPVWG